MSATVLTLLYAVADTSGIPPGVPSELAIESTPTDLVGGQAIVEDAAQENPPAAPDQPTMLPDTQPPAADPDLWLYRKRTVGLLRRYMRLSIEVGRLPSLLGREFFRTRVTSYRAATFEDASIFVHDVERSLEKLSEFDKKLIAKIVLQEYPQEEAARLLGCGHRQLARYYVEALDRVSEIFLKRRLLLRLPCVKPEAEKSCQGGKSEEFDVSDSEQAENKGNNILAESKPQGISCQQKPSNRLLDSLSGLPSKKRMDWRMCVLQAAIDDSGSDLRGPLYVLGGYLAKAEEWAKFSDEWEVVRDATPAISYFKLSEANRLEEQFKGWTREDADKKVLSLAKVIPPHVMYHLASVVVQADYDEIVMPFRQVILASNNQQDKTLGNLLKTPYFLLFYDIITECMKRLGEDGKLEEIEFYFDEQGVMGTRTRSLWDYVKRDAPPELSRYMTNPPQFKDEKVFFPLQAADMIAGLTAGRFIDMMNDVEPVRPALYELRTAKPSWSIWDKKRLQQFLEEHMDSHSEYEKFDGMMKQLIKVPHSIVKARMDAEKAKKRPKRKTKKKLSALGHVSDETD